MGVVGVGVVGVGVVRVGVVRVGVVTYLRSCPVDSLTERQTNQWDNKKCR